MDHDRAKGANDEMVGSAKQSAGELTGDPRTGNNRIRMRGAQNDIRSQAEKFWMSVKDAIRKIKSEALSRRQLQN
jgi:uncharacterized protein YjbJ (UPF0337 family)